MVKLRALHWLVIVLALCHLSYFTNIEDWLLSRKSYEERIESIRINFQSGIVLPLFALEENYPYKTAIDEISDLGARSVSIFITNYQEDIRSNHIYVNRRAIEATQLTEIVNYAHQRGLTVFLFPTLHIQHLGYKEWRGKLSPANPELWWKNYFRMIRLFLLFAREHQVEMFSIGSELCSLEKEYDRWSKIIRYARANYSGLLTYSANWDHYRDIPFVKDLDYLGMNAYFGLSQTDKPKLDELIHSWRPARQRVLEAYEYYRKPLIFTEIGYPSVDGASRQPWNYHSSSPVDLEEQALCYQAFVDIWHPPPPFLHGVYFYNWWGPGGYADRDYTPRLKPAEKILRSWYGSL